jgi:PAS domain S-box-containing protein
MNDLVSVFFVLRVLRCRILLAAGVKFFVQHAFLTGHRHVLFALVAALCLLPHGAAEDNPNVIRVRLFELPPLHYTDQNGEVVGFFPDLVSEVADQHGWTIEYVPASFADCLANARTGRIDLATTVAYSPDRAEYLTYSTESVMDIWSQAFVQPTSGINTMRDLQGQSIGLMAGDVVAPYFHDYAQRLGLQVSAVEYPSHQAVLQAVTDGHVVAGITPQHFGLRFAPDHGLVETSIQFAPFSVFFVTGRSENQYLLNAFDAAMQHWRQDADSFYFKNLSKWLYRNGADPTVIPMWLWLSVGTIIIAAVLLAAVTILLRKRVRVSLRALHERTEDYRALVEGANCVIVRMDLDGRLRYMNQYGLRLFDYTEAELIGQYALGTIVPDLQKDGRNLKEMMATLIRSPAELAVNENENMRRDGSRLFMQWSNRPLYDDQGNLEAVS